MNLKNLILKWSVFIIVAIGPHYALAQSIEAQLTKSGRKGQSLLIKTIPIFALVVGYLYKKGDPAAKDKLEGLIKGSIIVAAAFGLSHFFK